MSPDPKQSTGIISNHPIIGLIQLAALSEYVALWNDKLGKKTEQCQIILLTFLLPASKTHPCLQSLESRQCLAQATTSTISSTSSLASRFLGLKLYFSLQPMISLVIYIQYLLNEMIIKLQTGPH